MSLVETLWIYLPWVAVLAALLLFAKKRRKTVDYAESQAFKAALPWWVSSVERLIALTWAYILAVGTWKLYFALLGHDRSATSSTAGRVYVVLGIGVIVLPMALLCANAVSWLVPCLRGANERAFRGNGISFKTANMGLIKFAAGSVPAGLLALGVATIQPWLR